MKIYCKDCKYYIWGCEYPKLIRYKDTPTERVIIYPNEFKLNAHNNCKFFERKEKKRWYR